MNRRLVSLLWGAAGVGVLLGGASAYAQPAARPAKVEDEIIVTATKRPELLRDIPASIAAVSGDDLATAQAFDLQDIARLVPGLDLQQGGTPGLNRIILRGQNSGGDGATVATVVDEAPLSFSGSNTNGAFVASDFDTGDLARIEVLKGPQGTLYGATAEGGLVRYVTNAPSVDAVKWSADGAISTLAHGGTGQVGRGMVNVPLGEAAAVRATGYYQDLAGWNDNAQLGKKDLNEGRRYGGRISTLWNVTDKLTLRTLAMFQNYRQDGDNTVAVNGLSNPSNPLGLVGGLNLSSFTPNSFKNKSEIYSADLAYDFGATELRSITSYGTVDARSLGDNSGFANLFGPSTTVQSLNSSELEKFSQEIRLASKKGAKFDWQLGAFYTREDVVLLQNINLLAAPSAAVVAPLSLASLPSQFEDKSVYADATFHITPTFDIGVGARASKNEQSSVVTTDGLLNGGRTVFPGRTGSDTSYTYQIAPRWKVSPSTMLYARIATGYRPGGPSIPIPGAPPGLPTSFGPDSTTNYEAGIRSDLLGGAISADLTAFYIDWKDIQILNTILVGSTGYTQTGNAGKAVSKGIEWNVTWRPPVEGLSFNLVGAYVNAELTKDAPVLSARKGDALAYVPKVSNRLNIGYERPAFGSFTGFVQTSWAHTGKRFSDFPFHAELPSYDTYSLEGGLRNDRYTLQVFGKNLSDEIGITSYSPVGGFGGRGTAGIIRPREIGVRLAVNY